MPYVKKEKRPTLNKVVELMKEVEIKADGDLNYILYAYCKKYVTPSYNNYKNYVGELNECLTEIRRRLLAPYEEEKIKENGEVE
jgi:hypothetical protein